MARGRQKKQSDPRRFASQLSAVIIAIGVVVALIVAADRWNERDTLEAIDIEGRVVLDSAEIISRAGIEAGASIEELDLESIERGVAAHPYITSAAVYRGGRGRLVVEIIERTPVAILFVDGAPFYVDSQAVLLPYRFSAATFDVPVLAGVADGAGADSVLTRRAVGLAQQISNFDELLYRSVSEIRSAPDGEFLLIMADGGIPVRIGSADDAASRLAKLDAFLKNLYADGDLRRLEYIDLRWNGQVVVRWKDGGNRT